ncbi:MAG: type II toxin-antitoxin system Phd/YefM family antitoxin [Anaerolineae bacterium]
MDETIGIRELKAHVSELLKCVREDGASYTITHRGQAVALLTPVRPSPVTEDDDQAFSNVAETLAVFDALAEDIARHLAPDSAISAVEMIREQRRDL